MSGPWRTTVQVSELSWRTPTARLLRSQRGRGRRWLGHARCSRSSPARMRRAGPRRRPGRSGAASGRMRRTATGSGRCPRGGSRTTLPSRPRWRLSTRRTRGYEASPTTREARLHMGPPRAQSRTRERRTWLTTPEAQPSPLVPLPGAASRARQIRVCGPRPPAASARRSTRMHWCEQAAINHLPAKLITLANTVACDAIP